MLVKEPQHEPSSKTEASQPKSEEPPKKQVIIPAEKLGASYQHIIPTVKETKETMCRSASGSPVLGEAANARPVIGVTSSIPIYNLPLKKRYSRMLKDQQFFKILSTNTPSRSETPVSVGRVAHHGSSSSSCASSVDPGNHAEVTEKDETSKRETKAPLKHVMERFSIISIKRTYPRVT